MTSRSATLKGYRKRPATLKGYRKRPATLKGYRKRRATAWALVDRRQGRTNRFLLSEMSRGNGDAMLRRMVVRRSNSRGTRVSVGVAVWASMIACEATIGDVEPGPPANQAPPFEPLVAGLRTMTAAQYAASVREVLQLDADDPAIESVGQWPSSISAARGGFAADTVESYETAARAAARHAFADAERRAALVDCAPPATQWSAEWDICAQSFVASVGRRAFRRALSEEEIVRWSNVAQTVAGLLDDPYLGMEHALSGILQSPHFLYRVELGEPDGERLAYTDVEMATRLSFLVWNHGPDTGLLDVAEAGGLRTVEDIEAQVRQMLDDPRAGNGVRGFLAELLSVSELEHLQKSPLVFPDFDSTVAESMGAQLLRTAEDAMLDGGFASLFTTRDSYANEALAPIMGMDGAGYGAELSPVRLDADGPRAGILTLPGYLALHAYPGKTSPALRGLFVRQRLLCQSIPPPPPDVSTMLPDRPDGELVTTRELVGIHQQNPSCATCHALMDPIGLGLEEFDAVGGHRTTENMLDIDPSGVLEGAPFEDAVGLGRAVSEHPRLIPCMVATLYAFGAANTVPSDAAEVAALVDSAGGDDIAEAIVAIATSDIFRFAKARSESAGLPEPPNDENDNDEGDAR